MVEPIEPVIDRLIETAAPSSGADLDGFALDADYALFECAAIADRRLRTTDDPRCLVIIEASVSETVADLQEVGRALRIVWARLAYQDFQACTSVRYREATVLRFVTYLARGNLFVTGCLVASGGPYARLVDRFERDFQKLDGSLPRLSELDSLPGRLFRGEPRPPGSGPSC